MSLFCESKWSDNDVETLIESIKMHSVLWNSTCNDYKDPNARNAAFHAIARKVNMSTEEVRKKYRNLRTQYVREVRLLKTRGYGTKWCFFNSLKFLSSSGQCSKNANLDGGLMSEDTQDYLEQLPSSTQAGMPSFQEDEDDDVQEEDERIDFAEDYLEDCLSLNYDGDYTNDTNIEELTSVRKRLRRETNADSDKHKRRPRIKLMKQPQKLRDEHTVLGEQVANELRALKNQPALQKALKCAILHSILEVNKALNS